MATIEEAIAAIKSGDKAKGQEIIAKLLKDDRNNEMAWLWLTQTNITLEQKTKSLQNVLRINPDNEVAKEELQKLQARQPKSQPSPKTEPKSKGGLLKRSKPTAPPAKEAPSIAPIQDTKTCPYCAETIKAEAVVCRFCGRDLLGDRKSTQSPQKTTKKSKVRKKKSSPVTILLLGAGVAVLCLCSVLLSPSSSPSSNRTSSTPTPSGPTPTIGPTPLKREDIMAGIMCENFVKERLRAPATAKFVSRPEVYGIKDMPKNHHIVSGQVDAQNAFGAMLRSDYYCELHYVPEEPDRWILDHIEIE